MKSYIYLFMYMNSECEKQINSMANNINLFYVLIFLCINNLYHTSTSNNYYNYVRQ